MKSTHGDGMAEVVARLTQQLPGHAIILIVSGQECGAHVVANVPPNEQAGLFEDALKELVNMPGTLQ